MRKRSCSSSTVCRTAVRLLVHALRFLSLVLRSQSHLGAENLFLRKQLALYQERRAQPRRADDAVRITLVMLSRLIDWRTVLIIVKPDTRIRWHRKGVRLFWRWKSRPPGRPRLPLDIQRLIADGARECDVGRGTNCCRTATQAWGVRVAAYGAALHVASWATAGSRLVAAVEHLRAQPCRGDLFRRFRLLDARDGFDGVKAQ